MTSINLSTGDLRTIFTTQDRYNNPQDGVYQIYNIRKPDSNTNRKNLIMISDGIYNMKALLRHEATNKFGTFNLQKGDIIKVLIAEPAILRDGKKYVLLIDDFELLESGRSLVNQNCEFLDVYLTHHPEEMAQIVTGDTVTNDAVPKVEATNSNASSISANSNTTSVAQATKSTNSSFSHNNNSSSQKSRPIFAIEQLSPYQNVWTIKARVSFKGDVKTWHNQRGEGKLLNFNLLDTSGEIRATCFNQLVDKYNETIQEGKVYFISKARLQPSKPKFSNLSHPYELSIENDTIIEECNDVSTNDVPKTNFNFTKLDSIQNLETNSTIDVLGAIKTVNPHFELTSRAGKKFDRRDIEIVDETGFIIKVGLWNQQAIDFNVPEGSIVAIKGVRVTDFGGKSLSMGFSSTLTANPDISEAYSLKGWYDANRNNTTFTSYNSESGGPVSGEGLKKIISQRITIAKAKNDNLGRSEKGDFFSVKAAVSFLKVDNFAYPACSTEGCNKKVIEQTDGTWRCEKCDVSFPSPKWRYMLTISIMDETDQIWLTLFNEQAQQLIGLDASSLMETKENNPEEFNKITQQIQMKTLDFRIRAREDNYNDQTRIRYTVSNIHELKYKSEADYLAEELSKSLVF
ncbi:hypothetical protein TBLA_0G01500 [Henningerozyma blattae CBS 6284]|uniref:Replication protein A subunit n=1 Tax=Henningerozyma blattae (strain ATCC 34711 / CBS 6284 / DSM 70876 / NBRC 10599 / NRRL Y-10934 / UCD 77-7) TaxID=1071380 RepID=I2H6U4_HENB6|nr:hypothetical protein TBLA_0G01500 [Tetrapisispora blattae CBS 6284]CCH62096.1 hypothetical protein TBLA_0G01500 [Tetrapisispora blattae CBS 6284]